MRLTYLITESEPSKGTFSTRQTTQKVVAVEKGVEENNNINDLEEKDVLRRSWIRGTLTKESMDLIVGCLIAKVMWECLEEAYVQATKDKKFLLKQQQQIIRLGIKKIHEYIKEFKGICHGLATIHKSVDEYSKVINYARVLGLMGFDMREDDKQAPQQNHNMALSTQRGRGRGNNNFDSIRSRGRGFKQPKQETSSDNSKYGTGPLNSPSSRCLDKNNYDACTICGRNYHTTLKCFYMWDYSHQAPDELPQAFSTTNL
ncbi:hypothetical protein KY284_020150 [Solanum tuberosum]|nr:hypothetical protein KY284_020150 [Solanum tuberosum]